MRASALGRGPQSRYIGFGVPISALLLGMTLLAGCTTDQYARMLIQQDTGYGKINEQMVGSSDQLVKTGAITAARRVEMPDKTVIDVWVRKAAAGTEARGTVLALHGLCDSKVTYLSLARKLNEKGFDVVLPDLRAHGRISGEYVTFGALEKLDQQRVMDELLKEKLIAEPFYVFGASMGAAVAIDYAAIDPRVQGVLAVAPYRDMYSFCRTLANRFAPLMSEADFRKVVDRAGQIGGFKPDEASTVQSAAKARCPLLLMHGRLDTVVPFADSEVILAAAKGPKQLEPVPWAGHLGVLFGREDNLVKGIETISSGRIETATSQPALPEKPATQEAGER